MKAMPPQTAARCVDAGSKGVQHTRLMLRREHHTRLVACFPPRGCRCPRPRRALSQSMCVSQ